MLSWMRPTFGIHWLLLGSLLGSLAFSSTPGSAVELHALVDDAPRDWRLGPLKDLDGYFPFQPSENRAQWEARAAERRRAMKVALGIWPEPAKTPLNAVIHGKRDMGDYTIEKVYFESMPGFFVTGNLYRPAHATEKCPVVLCPHGHFSDGRFGDQGEAAVRREIVQGAERFEDGGRNPIQSRCVQLARMGCVVFNYDMIGYCDSTQISYELAHRFAKQRPEMIGTESWGFFSPQAESMLQSILGLQAWNSIRAVDFVSTLPDVDVYRIAVTGASGGGTQTFILGAIDPRPAVLVPAVMVSTAMQGGCTCENASLLRIGTGNVEFAALIAPRPLCVISANDWTHEMPTKGFPQLRQHFQMMGAADLLEHHPFLHFGHNYNYVSRSAMYQFMNRFLNLDLPSPVVEESYERLGKNELTVWDDQHPAPEHGLGFERKLLQHWTRDTRQQLDAVRPTNAETLAKYREVVGGGWQSIFHRGVPVADAIEFLEANKQHKGMYWQITGTVKHRPQHQDGGLPPQIETVPVACLVPDGWDAGPVVLWIHAAGKAALFEGDVPAGPVQSLLDQGIAVVGADLLGQGELHLSSDPVTRTRRVANDREAAAYTLGYNDSLFARRVHDVLTVIGFAKHSDQSPSAIALVGLGQAGPWAAAARTMAGDAVDCAALDTGGFRFLNIRDIRHPDFLPGGAKYDDVPGLIACGPLSPLWLAGESSDSAPLVTAAYAAGGSTANLHAVDSPDAASQALVEHLSSGDTNAP